MGTPADQSWKKYKSKYLKCIASSSPSLGPNKLRYNQTLLAHTSIFHEDRNTRLRKEKEEKEFDAIVVELKFLLKELDPNSVIRAESYAAVDEQEPIDEECTIPEIVASVLGNAPTQIE